MLCILFSYTLPFLPVLKGVFYPNQLFSLFVTLQNFFFFLQLKKQNKKRTFCLAFSTLCRCIKHMSCDLFDKYRYGISIKCTLQHHRKCNLMLNCMLLFFKKRGAVDFLVWQENHKASSFFSFCKSSWEKLIQVESPCNQTPLNYANPHAQVIVSSLHHLSPSHSSFPVRAAKDKGSLAGFLFWYFEKTCSFFVWVLMRNGRNGISFCTF